MLALCFHPPLARPDILIQDNAHIAVGVSLWL